MRAQSAHTAAYDHWLNMTLWLVTGAAAGGANKHLTAVFTMHIALLLVSHTWLVGWLPGSRAREQ